MSPVTGRSRTYRVRLYTSDAWEITLAAPSAEAAETRAEELWAEQGPEGFDGVGSGLAAVTSEEARS